MTTFAPSATNRRTVARPMPEQPPVMTATRSWMRPATLMIPFGLRGLTSSTTGGSVGDEDVLLLGERHGGVRTELPAEAGLLVATERRPVADRRVRVDAEVAGLDAARDPQPATEVAGVDGAGEAVLGVVRLRDRVGLVVEGHHGDHRPEDLLAPDPRGRVV